VPSIASINPQNIPAGGADFGVTVTGTGFVSTSVVRWNGADRFTFVANNTQLSATMHASDIASPGSAQITVFNSSPGGGTSGSATFTITPTTNAVPALTSFSPSPVFAGGVTFALTVHGSNFLSGSRVELDGSPLVTTFVSTIQLQATVNDFSILSPRTAHLDVVNGPPGGGTSAVLPVSIVPGGTPAGVIDIASVATDGTQGNKDSFHPSMSPDGRFIAFESRAFNLAPGATGGHSEIYVRDTCFGVSASCIPSTTMISVAPDGSEANSDCLFPSLSGGGRFVAFESGATNLVSGANNGLIQVLLHDRDIGGSGVLDQPGNTTNVLVSIGTDGNPANTGAGQASLNADGRFVAFESGSDNLVSNDTNSSADVFVRDTCAAAPAGCAPRTVRASMATDGTQTGAGSYSGNPSISADGRFVAFESSSGNLVPGFDRGGVFLRDTCLSVPVGCIPSTIGISIDGAGGPAFGAFASMSADARFVTFVSSGLIAGDTAGQDVYVRDTCQGAPLGCKPTTAQASIGKGGIQSNGSSDVPSISADGRFVGFQSAATNLAENNPNDTNGDPDFFVYDTCFGAPTACVPKTFQVSMANDGTQGQGDNGVDYPSIRVGMNGSVVIFRSSAPNLLPSLAHRQSDIFRVITSF
jgi:Tol biopolymer transport system component